MPSHPFICTFSIPAWDAPFIGRRHDQPGKRGGKVCPQCASRKACAKHFLDAHPNYIGGYYSRNGRFAHADPRSTRYEGWKDWVREHIPAGLRGIRATEERQIRVYVKCYFASRQRCDASNTTKAVVDVLFTHHLNGGDAWVVSSDGWIEIDKERPQVVVIVGTKDAFAGIDPEAVAERSKLLVPDAKMLAGRIDG